MYRTFTFQFRRLTSLCLLMGSCLPTIVQAIEPKACFLQAQSYYEQVYCEVKANGKGRALPSLIEFKRNNEMTQALLLKRDARSLGVKLAMPVAQASTPQTSPIKKSARPSARLQVSSETAVKSSKADFSVDTCSVESTHIVCDDIGARFSLLGNQKNAALSASALTASNRLQLSPFEGNKQDAQSYEQYLVRSYIQYLGGMQSIGLAGSTMTYGRFHYLFLDLESKGVDALARFAQMFEYLKQDKARNAISDRIEKPEGLSLGDCSKVDSALFVCARAGRNYLFTRS